MKKLEEDSMNDMTDIKDEIFDTNSTLFQVLDDNQVTDIVNIQSQLNAQGELIQENKSQLDGLARVVDNNQAVNARNFVEINTKLVEFQNNFDDIDKTFEVVNEELANSAREIQYLRSSVSALETTVGGLDYQFEGIQEDINTLKQDVSDNSEAILALRDNVILDLENLDRRITALDARVTALEQSAFNGLLQKDKPYLVRFKVSSESSYRTMTITWTSDNLKFGTQIRGTSSSGGNCLLTPNKVYGIDPVCTDLGIPLSTWLNATGTLCSSSLCFVVQEGAGVFITPQ